MKRRRPLQGTGESGQTLVMFAVILMLVLVGLLGLVVDLAAVVDDYGRDALAATVGAQAGATAVDQDAYYRTGRRQLVPARAQALCQSAADLPAGPPTCTVTGDTITVTVRHSVVLPIALGGAAVPISVTRQATGVFGGRTPDRPAGGG